MTELLPCPFCDNRDFTLTIDRNGWKIVQCDDCGMSGPCVDLEGDEYLDRWNTRAAQQDGAWQPISTAPKGEWIVGYTSWGQDKGKFHEHSGPCEWIRDHHEFVDVDFDVFPKPTHWLPYRKDRPADVVTPEQGVKP